MQPMLGIFLARDPWGGDQMRPETYTGFNYTMGNPVNLSDPSGLDSSGFANFLLCFDLHSVETLAPPSPSFWGQVRFQDRITAQQAVDICKSAYSKANWETVPIHGFDFTSDLPATAHDLFGWFLYDHRGKRETDRLYFDANQPLAQELAKTDEMNQLRTWYYTGQLKERGIREYQFDLLQQLQALMDAWKSAGKLSLPISMVLGSFWYQVVPLDNGHRIGFRIDNDTTLSSGTHVALRHETPQSLYVEDMISDYTSLKSKPIRQLIAEYPMIISILHNRTKKETGNAGGGNLYQTYLWSEEYDCDWFFDVWRYVRPHDLQVWDGVGTIDPPNWPAQ
jgi:hypothetical protein